MSVNRLYVEKKKGCDAEAIELMSDLNRNLGQGVTGLRLFVRYDVEGLGDDDFNSAATTVMGEPDVDNIYYEKLHDLPEPMKVFAIEYLPGQYDQRADSAAQCIALLTQGEQPVVRCARVYAIEGAKSLATIKRYLLNPVDSREASMKKPATLALRTELPESVETVSGFINMNRPRLDEYHASGGFAMTPDDLACAQEYFISEKRDPTITELRALDTYWSDHCRHTTFLTKLNKITFADDEISKQAERVFEDYMDARRDLGIRKDICLMDLATIYAKEAKLNGLLENLDVSEEINACSINCKVDTSQGEVDYLIMFKNETHNHPTEIEPFGGAATCLGGAIRDPLSGRSYVYQAMRVTGSGDPRESLKDTMKHKLPQRKITREAAQGYSSYGNQIGLATGLVDESYHPGYKAKRLEIGAVIGAAPRRNVVRETPLPGDAVILIGGRTGRDGIGGATGSSKAHSEASVEECGAEVQKGNPVTERKLQRLFRNYEFSKKVIRCNDFGAGGVCVAIGELADGLDIDLDAVPKKYEGLDGTELAISESQERMAVVVRQANVDAVLSLAAKENLEATPVAKVTGTGRLRMYWKGAAIVDIARGFLNTNGAKSSANAHVRQFVTGGLFGEPAGKTFKDTLLGLLSDLNVCSKKGLIEMFDSSIGAGTVTMPLGGARQLSPVQAMCALVPCEGAQSKTATLMSYGMDPYLMEQSPFLGSAYAILDSVAKIVASGGHPSNAYLTLQEYFERMSEAPESWGKPLGALLGAYWAQKELRVAAIGGKDSMSGSFGDLNVPPTLCSFCVAPVRAADVITPEFKAAGNKLYLVKVDPDEDGLPDFDDALALYEKINALINDKKIVSAWAIGRGGVLCGAAKCAFGNSLGVKLNGGDIGELTRKRYGSVLVEASDIGDPDFVLVGEVTGKPFIEAMGKKVPLNDAIEAYESPLESVFPTRTEDAGTLDTPLSDKKVFPMCRYRTALPRVVIPVFPGTNCEYDTAAAFEKAGAAVRTVIIRNLSPTTIERSMVELVSAIQSSQIIALPGGFSGGDEPDGSGKFIATVFKSGAVKDAAMELLKNRDGLILGICNGFQALIRLGLLPFGEIRDSDEHSPTLARNSLMRHASRMVNTRVTSVNSPWLQLSEAGEVHTVAVSHGEGRFAADDETIERLVNGGQIATQYVDMGGVPSMGIEFNPNGSMCAIEGLLSPDRRVFGKMGHSERKGEGLYKNIPGIFDQKIFESGVKYFR